MREGNDSSSAQPARPPGQGSRRRLPPVRPVAAWAARSSATVRPPESESVDRRDVSSGPARRPERSSGRSGTGSAAGSAGGS